jgi:transposase InsO family protein
MDQRMGFVTAYVAGEESVAVLCRHFGISRKSGHKWLARYRADGPAGLVDRARAPRTRPHALAEEVVEALLAVRHRHPSWGPRKVKAWLEDRHGDRTWPAASTIGLAFDRALLTRPRQHRRRVAPQSAPLAACKAPNDVWAADFKGWRQGRLGKGAPTPFLPRRTKDGCRVEPFTVSDGHSRFLIRCEAVECADEPHVWPILAAAFREHGLPRVLRSDNGPPFASLAAAGLSRLAVKLIKAGVRPERIAPGKPQQNGRHERLHLTLKQDTAQPPAASLALQIDRFEQFRHLYNTERPHEALGQVPPARVYTPSPRAFDGVLRSPDYPDQAQVRRVRTRGAIRWRGDEIFISQALTREPIGLFPIADDVWLVKYGPVVLGTMNGRQGFIRIGPGRPSRPDPHQNKTRNLSPM